MFSRISSRLIRPAQTQLVRVPKRFESVPAAAAAAAQQSNAPAFESSSVHHVTVLRSSLSVAADEPTLHPRHWSDADVQKAVESGSLKFFDLENQLGDFERAVRLRRKVVESRTTRSLDMLPYQHYDYAKVHGQCAENVIGYVPIPVGVAGPLVVDGVEYHIPLATTEGALVASTTRGCKAISMSGGARTEVLNDGISRAPVLRVPSIKVASQIRTFVEQNFDEVANVFNSTSRFARLLDIKTFIAGRLVYLRFRCSTGDAMGMNMVSKGVDKCLEMLSGKFPLEVLGLSGNVCTDKKPSAINWIEGRGKSVCAEAIIKADVVRDVLKTSADALVTLNHAKNLVGSAVAGSIGGNNAHAANLVTAAFLATGQDPAQNVESSNCLTIIEKMDNGDVYFSVNMPCLEVGTVGGGTILPGQAACLEMLGVKGSNAETPGKNAQQLARIIASTVMAGELSLMSAISAGHLIKSHLKLNRKPGAANGAHHANGTATNGAAKAANGANGSHRTNGAH